MIDVTKKHSLFTKNVKKWKRLRDCIEGEDAIKEAGTEYLPALNGQQKYSTLFSEEEIPVIDYGAYKSRASFFEAVSRAQSGLVGLITRKNPTVEWPKTDEHFLESVGREGDSFIELHHITLDEIVGIGRYGHLVDMSLDDPDSEPWVAEYKAETIEDWELGEIRGRVGTVYVSLKEETTAIVDEKVKVLERHRLLRLGTPEPVTEEDLELFESAGEKGWLDSLGLVLSDVVEPVYFQEVWDEVTTSKQDLDKKFVRTQLVVPRKKGGDLWREIPFTFYNPKGTKAKPGKPLLDGVAVLNISHYKNSADLEHGAHFTALPQPWAAGWDFKKNLVIGSGTAWVAKDPNAKAGYLEFKGTGLGFLKDLMSDKKREMATLASRLLEEQTAAGKAEAMGTVALRHSGENSALSRVSMVASEGLTRVLRHLAMFRGMANPESIRVEVNTDFGVEGLSPQMLAQLMEAVFEGHLSWNTLFWNAKRGELIPDGVTEEEEALRISAGSPTSLGSPDNPTAPKRSRTRTRPVEDVEEDGE